MKISVVKAVNKLKAGICDYLNKLSKDWSVKKLRVYWFFFILISVSIPLEICIHSIEHATTLEGFLRPKTTVLFIPRSLPNHGQERMTVLLSKIKTFKVYLDSLSLVDTTKYRALLNAQPFLLDSLHALETLLSQNLKR
jgi:hypothetical protein